MNLSFSKFLLEIFFLCGDARFVCLTQPTANMYCQHVTQCMAKNMREWCVLLILVVLVASSCWALSTEVSSPNRRRLFQSVGVGGAIVAVGVGGQRYLQGPPPFEPVPHSLDGEIMVITGGSSGLGLESGKRLAAAGATIVLTSRTAAKGAAAVQQVNDFLTEKGVPNDGVYSAVLDLDDLESVKAFPEILAKIPALSGGKKVDVLMNNAGVMAIPDRQLTKDGFERTFQSNHLGHFALTAKLANLLSDKARVINVSSSAHYIPADGLDLTNLNGEKEYGAWTSYGLSKLANILFTKELQERANKAGKEWKVVSLHPGAVQTDLARNMYGEEKWNRMKTEGLKGFDYILLNALSLFVRPVERGANTQIYLAAGGGGDDIEGGYFVDLKETEPSNAAKDMSKAKALWEVSEDLTGVKFSL